MRIDLLAPALGITLCVAVALVTAYGNTQRLVLSFPQDDTWTVIEYPEGQEVLVELKPASLNPEAKGTARVLRSGNETTINLDVSGATGESAHQVYIVDSLGNATLLGTLTVTDGAGSLNGKTVLSKFMIVVSPESDLTSIGSETKVALRSAVPSGFTVIAKEKSSEPVTTEPPAANAPMEPSPTETAGYAPQYEVPLLGIDSLKRGANTSMRANFSNGFEGTKATVVVRPQKNGPTQIKMRFINLREAPEGTQYLLWQVGPDNSYTLMGHLTQTARKHESMIDAETALSDFGLLITFENAQASTPMGSAVATIVR
jgi:hypothetical protein